MYACVITKLKHDSATKEIHGLMDEPTLSYPQKESSKEKTIGKRQLAIGSRVAQPVNSISPLLNEVEFTKGRGQKADGQKAIAHKRNQRMNLQIDQYLYGLISEGMIMEKWKAYFAKAIHTLGLHEVNMIVINVRSDTKCRNQAKLFAYKIEGAIQLHYKQIYDLDRTDNR